MVKVKDKIYYVVWCYFYYSICYKEILRILFLVFFIYIFDVLNEGRICYIYDYEGRKKVL